jgi:hypothetical protein
MPPQGESFSWFDDEGTAAMQKLNHFCCSSMLGKTIVIVFREGTFTF